MKQLVAERVSSELSLRLSLGHVDLYCEAQPEQWIRMPTWRWGLGSVVQAHTWIDVDEREYQTVIGGPLPAPGKSGPTRRLVSVGPHGYSLDYDILGLSYWMLSRAEEVGRKDLDDHGRFPASSSHALRNGYLDRPVVDEWFAILRQVVSRLWPQIPLVASKFEIKLSHDVDEPSAYAFRSLSQLLRNTAADVAKRGDARTAAQRPWVWLRSGRRLHPVDPSNTFDWIMSLSEHHGLRSTFFFVCGRTEPAKDPIYEIEHPAIRDLLRRIHARGHEVGLHPSYGSGRSRTGIATEAQRLLRVCAEERVAQAAWGARMHYLRWQTPETIYLLENAGIAYDNTLSYADVVGFRCGTCLEYEAFDPVAVEPLKLRVRPLVAMEVTLMSPFYMGLGVTSLVLDRLLTLKARCRAVRGCFTLLWHNNELDTLEKRELYESVLDG